MVVLMLLALCGVIVGALFAWLTRKSSAPPGYILLPMMFFSILLFLTIVWMLLPSAVELPEFLKK
jgi:hypothetical protein